MEIAEVGRVLDIDEDPQTACLGGNGARCRLVQTGDEPHVEGPNFRLTRAPGAEHDRLNARRAEKIASPGKSSSHPGEPGAQVRLQDNGQHDPSSAALFDIEI